MFQSRLPSAQPFASTAAAIVATCASELGDSCGLAGIGVVSALEREKNPCPVLKPGGEGGDGVGGVGGVVATLVVTAIASTSKLSPGRAGDSYT